MNKSFKFIHCADLHLGAMPLKIEERYEDFFNSFDSIVDYAIQNNINTILASGDLLHLKNINSKTLLRTTNILDKARDNKIEVIVIEGNHDKAFYVDEESWLNYLKEKKYIRLLSHKLIDGKIVDIDKYENEYMQVFGVGYLGTSTEKYIEEIRQYILENKTPNKFTILMLHAAVGRLVYAELASVKKEVIDTLKDAVDYIALGHIHYTYSEDDFYFNPGSTERLRLEEKNEDKGFYLVTLGENKNIEFVTLNTRKYVIERIDLENINNEEEIYNYIINYDFDIKKEKSVLCINLHGQIEWNTLLVDFSKIKDELIKKYDLLYVEINNLINLSNEDNSSSEINFEDIEKNEIEKEIKRTYPDNDVDELVKQTIKLKDALLNREDPEEIVKALYQSEVFNED